MPNLIEMSYKFYKIYKTQLIKANKQPSFKKAYQPPKKIQKFETHKLRIKILPAIFAGKNFQQFVQQFLLEILREIFPAIFPAKARAAP